MIKIEKTDVYGWEAAIRGMRNPMNSWDKSDSEHKMTFTPSGDRIYPFTIGDNDHDLMMRLANGGSTHAKYRRMITVTVDITAPLYWWKEFDTYKVGTVANSCSTMHKIHDKEFTLTDFSYEKLPTTNFNAAINRNVSFCDPVLPLNVLEIVIKELNFCRGKYLEAKKNNMVDLMNYFWHCMIQLLPSSYNQKRTVLLNYEVLVGMYRDRKNHKLDEWHTLCDWIRELPYSEIITGEVSH